MTAYALAHIDINGEQVPGPEVSILMDGDKVVTAVYVEVFNVSVTIKNEKDEPITLERQTVDTMVIPPGGEVSIVIDPSKDRLVIK